MDRINQIVLLLVLSAGVYLAAGEIKYRLTAKPQTPSVPVKPDSPKPQPAPQPQPTPQPLPEPEPGQPVKKVIKINTRGDFLKWHAQKNTFFVWSAKWCAACTQKEEAGWWARLQRDNQDIQVVYCDFDSLRTEASQKGIRVLPSVMMNNKRAAMESHVTYPVLLDWSRKHLQ